MRRYFFILFFYLITFSAFGQISTTDTTINNQQVLQADTNSKKAVDERFNKGDRNQMTENLNSFLQMQNERKAKEKRQAYIRIGIGIAFLIVLIVGLMRRRKKSAQ